MEPLVSTRKDLLSSWMPPVPQQNAQDHRLVSKGRELSETQGHGRRKVPGFGDKGSMEQQGELQRPRQVLSSDLGLNVNPLSLGYFTSQMRRISPEATVEA